VAINVTTFLSILFFSACDEFKAKLKTLEEITTEYESKVS
jgi:hypothetical protein